MKNNAEFIHLVFPGKKNYHPKEYFLLIEEDLVEESQ